MSKKNNKKRKKAQSYNKNRNGGSRNNLQNNKTSTNEKTNENSELHEEIDFSRVERYTKKSKVVNNEVSDIQDDLVIGNNPELVSRTVEKEKSEKNKLNSNSDLLEKIDLKRRKTLSEYRDEWEWTTERIPRSQGKVSLFFTNKVFSPLGNLCKKGAKKVGKGIKKISTPVIKKIGKGFNKVFGPSLCAINKKLEPAKSGIKKIWNFKDMVFIKNTASDEWFKFRRRMLYVYEFMIHKATKTSLVLAFISLMVIEACSRRSLGEAVTFMCQKPSIFILNYLIVLAPFLLAFAVTRKLVVYLLFSVLWILVGVTDYYLLSNRTTPFTGVDLKIDTDEISVIFTYLTKFEYTLIIILLIFVLLLLVALFIFSPRSTCRFGRVKSLLVVFGEWISIYLIVMVSISTGVLSTKFGNLGISYHDFGLPYCFIVTVVDTGIPQPSDYSEAKIEGLVNEKDENKDETTTKKSIDELPNVIFIQLESFIDPTLIKNGVKFSEDPMPFYRQLRENYSSGYLTVPTVVAGTCNTEFEVITGMSLEFFGPGEYPYKTILKETTCESMAYDLKSIGYKAHAIHNHTSGFYGRNEIYSHFGFDTFTGIEMMHDYTKVASGRWAKDDVLVGCIMDCLKSSKTKDLVYTVSVQCHGIYNVDLPEEEKVIDVSGIDDPELLQSYIYYVNQVKQVDNDIKELINQLSSYDEDVVLVLYGDHIPGLNLSDSMFEDKTIYETEYVVWDNMGLKKQDENLTSYQIASEVFGRVGIHEGTIFNYHQNTDYKSKTYLSNLENLQYDMLYGNRYVYNGVNPYKSTDIRYGVNDITIDKATYDGEYLYIEGGYFSNYSKLYVNGERVGVERISSTLMRTKIDQEQIPDGTILTVHQVNALSTEFYCSPQYVFVNDQYKFNEDMYQDELGMNGDEDANEDAVDPQDKK